MNRFQHLLSIATWAPPNTTSVNFVFDVDVSPYKTVAGLVLTPLPVGAWAFCGLTVTVVSKTLTFQQAGGTIHWWHHTLWSLSHLALDHYLSST